MNCPKPTPENIKSKGKQSTTCKGCSVNLKACFLSKTMRSDDTFKTDFKTKWIVTRDKDITYWKKKGSIHQEDVTIMNIYAVGVRAPKCMTRKLRGLKGKLSNHYWWFTINNLMIKWDDACKIFSIVPNTQHSIMETQKNRVA